MTEGWIDKPAKKLKRFPRSKGINIEPFEKLLEKGTYSKPLGLALEKEYGKRITPKEYIRKAETKAGIDIASMGLAQQIIRLNHRINQQIKDETEKHLQ